MSLAEDGGPEYDEFVRDRTPHLQVRALRPLFGLRRWLVASTQYGAFRPVVVFGSETRARNVGQRWHAAHAAARRWADHGDDGDLLGGWRARAEHGRLYSDDPEYRRRDGFDD